MIKLIVTILVLFLAALGGGSYLALQDFRSDQQSSGLALLDSIAALQVDSSSLQAASSDSASSVDSLSVSVSQAEVTDSTQVPQLPEEIRKAHGKFGKIFAKMPPEEAAKVLALMEDDVVRGVLMELPDRQAAAVLALFEGERAARLSADFLPSLPHPDSSNSSLRRP